MIAAFPLHERTLTSQCSTTPLHIYDQLCMRRKQRGRENLGKHSESIKLNLWPRRKKKYRVIATGAWQPT